MQTLKTLLGTSIVIFLGSCEDILEVPDISNESTEIIAPKDGTTVGSDTVNFTWNEVFEAEAYAVQIATPSFVDAAQIVLDSVIVVDSTFTGTKLKIKLDNSGYEWRVKAMNSAYETPYSNSTFTVNSTNQ